MKKEYNWWTDPKNAEEVEKMNWWNHKENKIFFEFPISIIQEEDYWIVTSNEDTEKLLGDRIGGSSQEKTKEKAIKKYFHLLRWHFEYLEENELKYRRWVPFRKGQWRQIGGTWFVVFGIHVYLRYGKGMKGGWYIPFTKLNISIYSEWITYRNYKNDKRKARSITE